MVYRVYVEKKKGQTHEADSLLREVNEFLQIKNLESVRVLNRYDVERIDEELFRISREGIQVNIQRQQDGTWIDVIRFADLPCIAEDFSGLLYYFSTAPDSYFVTQRIVNVCVPGGGSLALTGNRFTARRNGTITQTILETEAEILEVLEKEFHIVY